MKIPVERIHQCKVCNAKMICYSIPDHCIYCGSKNLISYYSVDTEFIMEVKVIYVALTILYTVIGFLLFKSNWIGVELVMLLCTIFSYKYFMRKVKQRISKKTIP